MNSDREFVDRVRSAADIARTIGEFVPLRRSGRRLSGLCPFHAEKTPSFNVDEQKQLFHCFGCGTGGDVFKFLMLHEKLDFREALEALAEKNGIEIPRAAPRAGANRGEKERLLEALAAAAAYYRAALAHDVQGRPGREYLEKRGLRARTIERLGIGYAPRGWEGLRRHLLGRGFTPAELAASGLVVPKADGSGSYDRFRERIMFPIVAANGKIVAFGGRTIAASAPGEGRSEPKYLNSPETPVYSKGETLYGLYAAREALKKEGVAILVEGYLDFASLFEAGIENVVASLGTAFTEGHARLIARYADGVVVNYDPDPAGRAATLRSLAPLVAKGLRVRVFRVPEGDDPDSYVRRSGADEYRRQLAAAPEYMDYAIEESVAGKDMKSARNQVAALNEILPLLGAIESPIERSRHVAVIADRLSLEDHLILREVAKAARERKSSIAPPPPREEPAKVSIAEAGLIRVLLESPEARGELLELLDVEWLGGLRTGPIFLTIKEMADRGEELDCNALTERLQDEGTARVLRHIAMQTDPVGDTAYARTCLVALERTHLESECRRIQRRIEGTSDSRVHASLVARKFQLSQRIRELS